MTAASATATLLARSLGVSQVKDDGGFARVMAVRAMFLDLFNILAVLDGVRVDLGVVGGRRSAVHLFTECCQITGRNIRSAAVVG